VCAYSSCSHMYNLTSLQVATAWAGLTVLPNLTFPTRTLVLIP